MVENDDNNNLSDEEKRAFKKRKVIGMGDGLDYSESGLYVKVENEKKKTPWYEHLFCCKFRRKIGPVDKAPDNGIKSSNIVIEPSKEEKLVDDTISKQNGATTIQNGEPESPAPNGILFPSIYSHSNGIPIQDYSYISQQKPSQIQYNDIDESKIQNTMSQLDELLSNSKSGIKSALTSRGGENQSFTAGRIQLTENETILPIPSNITKKISDHSNGIIGDNAKFSDQKQNKSPENTVTTAVAHINGRDQTPSTSSSNSTEFGILNGSGIRLQRLRNGSDKIGFSQKISTSRVPISKNNKITHSGSPFPENLKPFDRPKEGLDTCFSQLESQQWEVVMLGLTSLVRLLRHHPAIVLSQIHPIILALGRQIRNLRSQVSRAACQAAAEMFVALKRNIEVDLEVLAGPLFHRSADTNRFIRLDCGQALDNMTDNISPVKAVNVIISKGSTHQNAIVRTVAARLLLRLSEKVGTEKILTLPKEIRDKVVQTGANLLMEGKLETRAYAKELFRVWSSHPSFSNLMLEAIPPNVMRHISKTLISLKT
ncbi:UNVERIFIED_CONTAM: hypothetical protein PYX00_009020 [Menopon gallinae]|uniref:TOG domain-containing protein n=1 Tax=Menopon gallinae TaxID=328185 RepID=A0AAW2H9J1_9NEOP